MVDEEAYCTEVLTQIGSIVSAMEKIGAILLKDHVEHCVHESIEKSEDAGERWRNSQPQQSGSCESKDWRSTR